MLVVTLASLIPIKKGIGLDDEVAGPFNKENELINGRIAMTHCIDQHNKTMQSIEMSKTCIDIINYFRQKDVKIALATLNPMGKIYLVANKLDHLFDAIECVSFEDFEGNTPARSDKRPIYKKLQDRFGVSGIEPGNTSVFEDSFVNKVYAERMGMKCQLVEARDLIKWVDVQTGLRMFLNLRRSSSW